MKRQGVRKREKREGVKEAVVGDKSTTMVAAERGEKARWVRGGEERVRLVGNALSRRVGG